MSPRLTKRVCLTLPVVFAALAMLGWTQPWARLQLEGTASSIVATGGDASMAVMALALAALAATAAVAVARGVWRVVLAAVLVLLGAALVVVSLGAWSDLAGALAAPVSEATAIGGDDAVRQFISTGRVAGTVWPLCAVAGGAGIAFAGVLGVCTARSWSGGGRRFDRDASSEYREGETLSEARVSQWDALSAGEDPTDEETLSGRVD